jgi:hypothetical protein
MNQGCTAHELDASFDAYSINTYKYILHFDYLLLMNRANNQLIYKVLIMTTKLTKTKI